VIQRSSVPSGRSDVTVTILEDLGKKTRFLGKILGLGGAGLTRYLLGGADSFGKTRPDLETGFLTPLHKSSIRQPRSASSQ